MPDRSTVRKIERSVYYDQWKELSPSSIGLVSVGIVVLLAGVWIVSIQSSEGEGEDGMGGKADVDVGKGVQVDEESRLLGGEDEGFDSVDEEEGEEHRGNVGRYMRQDGTDGDIEEDDAEEKRRSAFKDKLGEVYKVLMTGMDEVSSILANGSVSHRRGSGGEGSKKVGAGAGAGALRGFSIGIAASSPGESIPSDQIHGNRGSLKWCALHHRIRHPSSKANEPVHQTGTCIFFPTFGVGVLTTFI